MEAGHSVVIACSISVEANFYDITSGASVRGRGREMNVWAEHNPRAAQKHASKKLPKSTMFDDPLNVILLVVLLGATGSIAYHGLTWRDEEGSRP